MFIRAKLDFKNSAKYPEVVSEWVTNLSIQGGQNVYSNFWYMTSSSSMLRYYYLYGVLRQNPEFIKKWITWFGEGWPFFGLRAFNDRSYYISSINITKDSKHIDSKWLKYRILHSRNLSFILCAQINTHIWIYFAFQKMRLQSRNIFKYLLQISKVDWPCNHPIFNEHDLKGLYHGSGFCPPHLPCSWWTLARPAALLIVVNFNHSDAPSAQDNLSKLLATLSP